MPGFSSKFITRALPASRRAERELPYDEYVRRSRASGKNNSTAHTDYRSFQQLALLPSNHMGRYTYEAFPDLEENGFILAPNKVTTSNGAAPLRSAVDARLNKQRLLHHPCTPPPPPHDARLRRPPPHLPLRPRCHPTVLPGDVRIIRHDHLCLLLHLDLHLLEDRGGDFPTSGEQYILAVHCWVYWCCVGCRVWKSNGMGLCGY